MIVDTLESSKQESAPFFSAPGDKIQIFFVPGPVFKATPIRSTSSLRFFSLFFKEVLKLSHEAFFGLGLLPHRPLGRRTRQGQPGQRVEGLQAEVRQDLPPRCRRGWSTPSQKLGTKLGTKASRKSRGLVADRS